MKDDQRKIDERYMKLALTEAKIAANNRDWPIGCVVVIDGKVIVRDHNAVYSTHNKLAHAEIQALAKIQDILKENHGKAVLYTTYEPCPMCFGASILSRIGRVVAGIDIDRSGAMYFKKNLPKLFKQEKFHVEFTTGVLADKCRGIFLTGEPTKKLIDSGNLLL